MNPNFWRELELRHLVALRTIARAGTFWAAADSLDCTPSSLSQQIARLEREAGHRLLERSSGRRRVEVTEAGRLLLENAEAIVSRLQAAQADLDAFDQGETGSGPRSCRPFSRSSPAAGPVSSSS